MRNSILGYPISPFKRYHSCKVFCSDSRKNNPIPLYHPRQKHVVLMVVIVLRSMIELVVKEILIVLVVLFVLVLLLLLLLVVVLEVLIVLVVLVVLVLLLLHFVYC